MKNLIIMLLGGLSREREISFLTGAACLKALKKKGYKVKELDAKSNFVSKLKKLPVTEVLENVKKSHANKYTKAIETLESICEHNTGWLKENK